MEIFDLRWKVELHNTNYSSRGRKGKLVPNHIGYGSKKYRWLRFMVKTTQWYCLVVFLWTRTRHTPIFWWWKSWGPKPNQRDTVHTPAVTGSRQDHDGISAEYTLERPYLVYESFHSQQGTWTDSAVYMLSSGRPSLSTLDKSRRNG